MDLSVAFKDVNLYCRDQLRKHVSIIQYYLEGETWWETRNAYFMTMRSMLWQQESYIRKAAEVRGIANVDSHLGWLFDMRREIDKLQYPHHH